MIVVTLTTTTLELVEIVEDTGTLDELLATTRGFDSAILETERTDDATLEDEELRDTARLLVTANIEVTGVDDDDDDDTDEDFEVLATFPAFELMVLEVAMDDAELDVEDAVVEGVALETEVETPELDRLLKDVEGVVDGPALEPVEVLCDTGRMFVATPVAAVLTVVVKTRMG